MAWYDTVKSWFAPKSTEPEYWEFETPPPITAYPKPEYWEFETPPVYKDSLWDSFRSTAKGVYEEMKDLAPDVASFYTQIQALKKPVDNTALIIKETPRADIPRQDFAMSTPYQRSTGSTQPAKASLPGGLSMPLLLVGAGLIFLMLKKR